jgi:hypothetical protein
MFNLNIKQCSVSKVITFGVYKSCRTRVIKESLKALAFFMDYRPEKLNYINRVWNDIDQAK